MNPFSRFHGALSALLLVLSIPFSLSAQEQLGMRFERYAGLYGATLNPAQTAFMPHPWEVNLVAAEGFFENNYGYLTNTGIVNTIGHIDEIALLADTSATSKPLLSGDMQLGFFDQRRMIRGVFQGRITGPEAAVRIGENHVIGLVSAIRAVASGYQLPHFLRADPLTDRKRFVPNEISPIKGGLLSWGEVGLHYSYRQAGDNLVLAFGVTPKLLFGLEAAFARSNDNLDFYSMQRDSMAFSNGNWEIAMTTGNIDAAGQMSASGNFQPGQLGPQVNGLGAGIDAGVIVAMPSYDGASDDEYDWRFGISLIDFGLIRFKRNAEYHQFIFDSMHVVSARDYASERDPHSIIDMSNMAFLDRNGESLKADRFSAALPAAMVLQFDYRVVPNVFLGSVLVQRISMGKFAVKHVNTLSIMPRFEHRLLSVSAPLTLSDWQSFRMGLAFRLGWLTVGTDNLDSYFRQKKFTGSDVYVGFKVNGWEASNRSGRNGMSRSSMRKIKCFQF